MPNLIMAQAKARKMLEPGPGPMQQMTDRNNAMSMFNEQTRAQQRPEMARLSMQAQLLNSLFGGEGGGILGGLLGQLQQGGGGLQGFQSVSSPQFLSLTGQRPAG